MDTTTTNGYDVIPLGFLLPNGTEVRKIKTGAELMLAIALNAFTKKYMNKRVTCANIRVDKELMTSELYAYACDPVVQADGVIFHQSDKPYSVAHYNTKYAPHILSIVESLAINMTDEAWTFGYMNALEVNSQIRTGCVPFNYVYILAKWLVFRYMYPNKKPKLIIDQQDYTLLNGEYSALIILKKWGNKLFASDDLLELRYIDLKNKDSEWVAYFEEKRQRGMATNITNQYSAKDKREYLTKRLKMNVGDVVLLYKRKASKNSGDVTKNVVAAYPAVIVKIDANLLTLSYCTQTDLRLTRKYQIDLLRRNGANSIYSRQDYMRFDMMHKSFDWQAIGVDGYSTSESWIIIPPVPDDSTMQYINDGVKDCHVELNTIETIYALFEDRNIKYDKQSFLNRYFGEAIPIYEQFRRKRIANGAEK